MKWMLILVVGLVALVACSSLSVHVDYDHDAVDRDYGSFAWSQSENTSLRDAAPLMHQRVVRAITAQLRKDGLVEDVEDPDLKVTYYSTMSQEVRVDTTIVGYGYGPGWAWNPYWGWGGAATTTRVSTYNRGALVVDLWDAETKKLVWRGVAEDIISENPQKASAQIEQAVQAVFNEYRRKSR